MGGLQGGGRHSQRAGELSPTAITDHSSESLGKGLAGRPVGRCSLPCRPPYLRSQAAAGLSKPGRVPPLPPTKGSFTGALPRTWELQNQRAHSVLQPPTHLHARLICFTWPYHHGNSACGPGINGRSVSKPASRTDGARGAGWPLFSLPGCQSKKNCM